MIITVDFRLFLKKMLVFFQKLIPAEWLLTLFITELNQDLPLLEKRSRMEWETISPPDLVNLANQLAHALDESSQRKMDKILKLHLQK